jgi:hypothetical protein
MVLIPIFPFPVKKIITKDSGEFTSKNFYSQVRPPLNFEGEQKEQRFVRRVALRLCLQSGFNLSETKTQKLPKEHEDPSEARCRYLTGTLAS